THLATPFTCFLHPYLVTHRPLPSFPTRRSSDLAQDPAEILRPCLQVVLVDRVKLDAGDRRLAVGVIAQAGEANRLDRRTEPAQRSEEHTSELQSRGHLVCRLLLEKKKNQMTRER